MVSVKIALAARSDRSGSDLNLITHSFGLIKYLLFSIGSELYNSELLLDKEAIGFYLLGFAKIVTFNWPAFPVICESSRVSVPFAVT